METRIRMVATVLVAILLTGCMGKMIQQAEDRVTKHSENVHQIIVKLANVTVKDAHNKCDLIGLEIKKKREQGEAFEFDDQTILKECLKIQSDQPEYRLMCAEFSKAREKSYGWSAKSRYYVRDGIRTANKILIDGGLKPCL